MKKMMMLLMAGSAILSTAKAQDNKVYLKAGVNLANITTSSSGAYDNANSVVSFHAGFMADLPLGSNLLSFQPGLLFTGKGAKVESGKPSDAIYYKASINPYYLEIPANIVLNIPLVDKESKFFIGAGPYAAMGIAGKYKSTVKTPAGTVNSDDKINFTNDSNSSNGLGDMKRFDFGINGTAGFAFQNVLVSINYGHGLTKLPAGTSNGSDEKNKHRVWGLSFAVSL